MNQQQTVSITLEISGEVEVVRRIGEERRSLAVLKVGQVFGEKDLKFFPNIVAKPNFNISRILGERLADMVEQSKA